jgi:hypothetical protein
MFVFGLGIRHWHSFGPNIPNISCLDVLDIQPTHSGRILRTNILAYALRSRIQRGRARYRSTLDFPWNIFLTLTRLAPSSPKTQQTAHIRSKQQHVAHRFISSWPAMSSLSMLSLSIHAAHSGVGRRPAIWDASIFIAMWCVAAIISVISFSIYIFFNFYHCCQFYIFFLSVYVIY